MCFLKGRSADVENHVDATAADCFIPQKVHVADTNYTKWFRRWKPLMFFSDWWWLEHGNMAVIFPFHIWDVILPNWRNESFFRGVGIPPTRWLLTIINHIITIIINHYYGRYTTTNQALATVIPTEATQKIPRIRRPTHMRRRKKNGVGFRRMRWNVHSHKNLEWVQCEAPVR